MKRAILVEINPDLKRSDIVTVVEAYGESDVIRYNGELYYFAETRQTKTSKPIGVYYLDCGTDTEDVPIEARGLRELSHSKWASGHDRILPVGRSYGENGIIERAYDQGI